MSAARAVHITDPDALTALRGHKLMATVYDLIPLKEGFDQRRLVARAGYRSYLKALKRADTVFAISVQTAGDLVDLLRLPADRIRVARPGVDLPPSSGRAASHKRPYFLFVGGPNPNKNLSVLLDAMAICADLSQELLVAGHWLPKQVTALNHDLELRGLSGRVRHVGFVPSADLADLIRDATALVIPSLSEGYGLPVAEGLAAGAVVVHSRLPVLDETSQGSAMTFDPRSAAALAVCLYSAARDGALTSDLRRRGAERAKELTWDAAVETTLSAYRAELK